MIISHRCKGSLAARTPIRFYQKYDSPPAWWLFYVEYDYDSFSTWINPLVTISFCPFCGIFLSDPADSLHQD